jgi:hypothetical protein
MGFGIAHAYGHPTAQFFGWPMVFALFSLLVSLGALVISVRGFVDSKRPVLVFERTEAGAWVVKNLGNGPALNVVLVEADFEGTWLKPVKLPSLSKDGSLRLANLKVAARLGAIYTDFDQRLYSSDCTYFITKIRKRRKPPGWPSFDASTLAYYQSP